jgi:hypothetical protein
MAWFNVWDVILPAFMTMAGDGLLANKNSGSPVINGSSLFKGSYSFWLLFLGILIYSVRDGHLNWQLQRLHNLLLQH